MTVSETIYILYIQFNVSAYNYQIISSMNIAEF